MGEKNNVEDLIKKVRVEPGKKVELPFEIRRSLGRNEKQNNVTLEDAGN